MFTRNIKIILALTLTLVLASCGDTYQLHKFYRDPSSTAAIMMGSTYAGVVDEFDTLEECLEVKRQVERDDAAIGYTNSRFECEKK